MSFTTNYEVDNSNYNNKDLSTIFPCFETASVTVSNNDEDNDGTITLTNNKTGTDDYKVFATYFYNKPNGTSGTYNKYDASTSAHSIITCSYTSSSFTWAFTKSTGDNWNGGINFLIIYN